MAVSHLVTDILNTKVSSQDELLFFDRTKQALEGEGTYDDFLKLLNLFAQDVINTQTLIEQATHFLGDSDLMVQFKELMGWDEKATNTDFGPPDSIRTRPPDPQAPVCPDDGKGPSYRRLPDYVSGGDLDVHLIGQAMLKSLFRKRSWLALDATVWHGLC